MRLNRGVFCFILILFFSGLVFAHQPRLVYDEDNVFEKISNPEISQAFYGELKGEKDYYFIQSEKEFNLYLNILSPDIKNSRTDFSVEIFSDIGNFTLKNNSWEKFYEEFGGDSYLRGSEFEKVVPKGFYLIAVSNPNNSGRYSLAVGKIESFPLGESFKAVYSVLRLKHAFFDKSYFAFFQGIIGKAVLFIILLVSLILFLIKRIFLSKKKKK